MPKPDAAPAPTDAPAAITLSTEQFNALLAAARGAGGPVTINDPNALPDMGVARARQAEVDAEVARGRMRSVTIGGVAFEHQDPESHELLPATCNLRVLDRGAGAGWQITELGAFSCPPLEDVIRREVEPPGGGAARVAAERTGPSAIAEYEREVRRRGRGALYRRGWLAALRATVGKPLRALCMRSVFAHPDLAAILSTGSDVQADAGGSTLPCASCVRVETPDVQIQSPAAAWTVPAPAPAPVSPAV